MQFTLVALVSLIAVAIASPVSIPSRVDDITAREAAAEPQDGTPAMTNAAGDVVGFNTADVYLATSAAGQ